MPAAAKAKTVAPLRLNAEDLRAALEAAEAVESAAQGAGMLKACTFTIAGSNDGDSDYTLVYEDGYWYVTTAPEGA